MERWADAPPELKGGMQISRGERSVPKGLLGWKVTEQQETGKAGKRLKVGKGKGKRCCGSREGRTRLVTQRQGAKLV